MRYRSLYSRPADVIEQSGETVLDIRHSSRLECLDDSRTKQSFKDECDINNIVSRYKKTGVLPDSARAGMGRYGDFSAVPSYHEMHQRVLAANEVFALLPAKIRRELGNDPGALIRLSETPDGVKRLVELGLGKEPITAPPGADPQVPLEPPKAGLKTKSVKADESTKSQPTE